MAVHGEPVKAPLLSEDEKRGIAIRIIAEGTAAVVSAMVDIVGPETTVEVFRPHFEHAGLAAGALLKKNVFCLESNDIGTIQLILTQTNHCFSNRGTRNSFISREVASCEVVNCTYCEGSPELCTAICDSGSNGVCRIINPAFEMKMLEMQTKGSPRCYWVLRKKGSTETETDPKARCVLEPVLDEEEMRSLQMQYMGEFWLLVNRGFLDVVEKRAARRVLEPWMRLIGLRLGLRLKSMAAGAAGGPEMAVNLARLVGECIGQDCSAYIINDGGYVWRARSCPFFNAPEELCRHLEAVIRGVCQAIDPGYEFTAEKPGAGEEGCLCRVHHSAPSLLDRLWRF